jgi:hypothetical protein
MENSNKPDRQCLAVFLSIVRNGVGLLIEFDRFVTLMFTAAVTRITTSQMNPNLASFSELVRRERALILFQKKPRTLADERDNSFV